MAFTELSRTDFPTTMARHVEGIDSAIPCSRCRLLRSQPVEQYTPIDSAAKNEAVIFSGKARKCFLEPTPWLPPNRESDNYESHATL